MRRPQTIEWSAHHTNCCQALTDGGNFGDLRLVQTCQLVKIAQDISKMFCYDTRPKSSYAVMK